ncbi:MAG: S8 family peptidase [Pseudonocardiaceae bacterium]
MSTGTNEVSPSRPVLLGAVSLPRAIPPRRGGPGRVEFRNTEQRIARLDTRFNKAMEAFQTQVQLAESIHAADPQLVLVFESIDEQIDLAQVAHDLGLEILVQSEGEIEPTEEYVLKSEKSRPFIKSCLHAICFNQRTFDRLLLLWGSWKRDRALDHGLSKLRDLFAHLGDVRPWGPQDRLKMIDWDEYFAGQITDHPHAIEIELWYRRSPQARTDSQRDVTTLLGQAGGQVLSSKIIDQIGYHGLKCTVPTSVLVDLANQRFDAVQVVKSANVLYLRITGQAVPASGPVTDADIDVDAPLPDLPPIVCLLDGVPATNHPLLKGRVVVHDPDDLASESTVGERKHGTWMSSVAVWGDRGSGEAPASRQVFVRPILTPSPETTQRSEELPADELTPDLMWQVFRELFDSVDGVSPVAPQVAIVNLSVGDPATPFDCVLSSWARMIDWLSYKYGVLVVVSAGNHRHLPLTPSNSDELVALTGDDRRQAVLKAQQRDQNQRRLLSPAESINAITVGAVHADSSKADPVGYVVDPTDGLAGISPITALGTGYRRSVKPELATDGGRVMFRQPAVPADSISFTGGSPLGPGIRVASPGTRRETFIAGTSPAAALITRQAAKLHDLLDEIITGVPLTRRQRAAAIKALLVHGTGELADFSSTTLPIERAAGNGVLVRDFSQGCASNEAVLLFIGTVGAVQEQDLLLPLPNELSVRETKRINATLAWLSPVNWRHRQYRRAALSFVKPAGAIPTLGKPRGLTTDTATRGATTVQHQTWETQSAFAAGQGSNLAVRVKCYEQAGGLNGETVDYAVALSLWVAPTINVDVYTQVRDQIQTRVPIRPE